MSKKDKYWQERAEKRIVYAEKKCLRYETKIKEYFRQAEKDIEKQIHNLYGKYAKDNELSYQEAVKYLTENERKEFQKDLKYYTEKAKNPYFRKEHRAYLQALSTRARVQRLEEFKAGIHFYAENTYAQFADGAVSLFSDVLKDTSNRTAFDIFQYQGFGHSFSFVSENTLSELLAYPWSGSNFSEKIWGNAATFEKALDETMTRGMIQGKSVQNMVKDLREKTEQSKFNATRLVRTESNFIANQATNKMYENLDVEEYEYLAILDTKTSEMCFDLDGKHFPTKDAVAGENYPPMHPNCRSTTTPYFEDMERQTRHAYIGKEVYDIPKDMTYKQWKEKYIDNNPEAQRLINEKSDKKQYDRYKEVLGTDAPKSFAKFQDLKYNNGEGYSNLKADYRKLNYYNKVIQNEPAITDDLKNTADKTSTELVGLEFRLKSKESFLRKVNLDSDNSLNLKTVDETLMNLNDIIRYTYQVDYDKLVNKYFEINENLGEKGYSLVKIKNTWTVKSNPYKGINCVYKASSGQKFEVQYHTPESFELKNGELHTIYEKWRNIKDKSSDEAIKLSQQMSELSSKLKYPKNIDEVK